MRICITFITASLMLASLSVSAEQLYVEDKLVLNVYSEPNQTSARVATIETGDAVEALERVEQFVRVQLADGREGWVGANYLSAQPPAIVKLKELQSASGIAPTEAPKQLTEEIARLKKQNSKLTNEIAEMKKNLSAPTPVPMSTAAAPAAHTDVEPLPPAPPERTIIVERSYWWAWALAVLAAGGAGFFAGYQTLGRRVRERFGGVKVY